MSSPVPYSPTIREWSWKKTPIKKKFFRCNCKFKTLFLFKDLLYKNPRSRAMYCWCGGGDIIAIRVVSVRLLITEKPSVTFTPELLNTLACLILEENVLKIISSLQYLNIQCTQNWCDVLIVVTKYSKSSEVKLLISHVGKKSKNQ